MLSSGIKFKGKENRIAKKIFENPKEAQTLGELTDYSVLDSYQVTYEGDAPPKPTTDWSILSSSIQNYLLEIGFTQPTPIQKYCISAYNANRSFIGISPTGSGKTLAYALPLLEALKNTPNELQALIILPTRELCSQVYRQFRRFEEASPVKVQELRKNRSVPHCQILIATPKRLTIMNPDLSHVRYVVFDEADNLLSGSFVTQTDKVLVNIPKGIHYALFSATMTPKVEETARSFMTNPIRIQIGDDHTVAANITQELKFVGQEKGKVFELCQRIQSGKLRYPAMIFVMDKRRAFDLRKELPINSAVLTSDETDSQRADAIRKLRTGEVQILITTDLGGRGIDLAALQTVVNFDLPPDSTTYIHRIGRTARAGREGYALTFFTTDDQRSLRPVASVMKRSGYEVEDWMMLKPDRQHIGARGKFQPKKRKTISSTLWKDAKPRMPKPKLTAEVEEE